MASQKIICNKFVLLYGFLLSIIYILIEVLDHNTEGVSAIEKWGTPLFYLLFFAAIFHAVVQYKNHNGGFLKLSQAIKIGLTIAIISGVIIAIYMMIYRYVIAPESMAHVLEEARKKLMENPDISKEMVDKMMVGVKIGAQPWFTAGVWLILSVVFGLFYSLIAGLIMKKDALEN